jgi:hypothetical protein
MPGLGKVVVVRSQLRAFTVLLIGILMVAACGSSSTPPTLPPTAAPSSSGAVASAPPVPAPSRAALTASWVRPAVKSKLKTYRLDLAAKTVGPAAAVTFKVAWSGGSFAGCRANEPTADHVWSCSADLLGFGTPPGNLDLSFEVLDSDGTVAKDLAPARSITYAIVPPKPVATYRVVSNKATTDGTRTIETDKVTWLEPAGYATEFRLYGFHGCPNDSKKTDGQPCLVEHMKIPANSLELVKKVSGSARSMTLKHTLGGEGLWS